MLISGVLLFWAYGFHALSRCCFFLAETYFCLVSAVILTPLGYRPMMVLAKGFYSSPKASPRKEQPAKASDIQQLHSSVASLHAQVRQLQVTSSCNTPQHQDNVQRWFHSTAFDAPRSSSSSTTLSAATAASHRRRSTNTQPAACAAAAAAMALYGQAGMSIDATAAAVGAAAVFAQQMSSSDPDSSCSSKRESSCCTVPPLEYDASAEEQRELEDSAPPEFLCPIGRVLMTDPVCTPSGFTYQRPYIEDFLLKTGHDPARDTPLNIQALYPNILLRDQIATWLQKRGIAT